VLFPSWLSSWQEAPLFDETDRLVLRYADSLTQNLTVDDALWADLAARFTGLLLGRTRLRGPRACAYHRASVGSGHVAASRNRHSNAAAPLQVDQRSGSYGGK
jgi:hypothetical protein